MAVNPSYPDPTPSSAVSSGTVNPSYGLESPESSPAPTQGEPEPEAPGEPETELDESLTHAELDEIAEERGVDLPSNLTKAEKIELLNSL